MIDRPPRFFVDTNILVYAYDASAGDKRDRARELVSDLWESGQGCLSVQVLQEFLVAVTRKVPNPLDLATAALLVADFSRWQIHTPDASDVLGAIDIHRHSRVSFWDAMIIRSARTLSCDILYSEDLNPGQRYGGVRVRNPFMLDSYP